MWAARPDGTRLDDRPLAVPAIDRSADQHAPMHPIAQAAALLAAIVHVWFFVLETVIFDRPRTWSRFGVASAEQAAVVRSWAWNQGFYNLFLAAGVAAGLALDATGDAAGGAVTIFACASMTAAGVVLVAHDRRFLLASLVQAVPPVVAILALALLRA